MNKISIKICFFALAALSLACNKDESPDKMVAGEWVLIEIGSSWTREFIKGEDITYEEKYNFRQDGTFVKSRKGSSSDAQATGTFTVTDAEPNQQNIKYYLLLTFETGTGNKLITSCYPGQGIEDFTLFDNGRLLNNAGGCDMPVLTYQKKQ